MLPDSSLLARPHGLYRRLAALRRAPAYTVALLTLLGLGCGDGTDTVTGANGTTDPTTGSIHVSLAMSGAEVDADGCTVTVDGGSAQRLNPGASVAFSHLPAGTHEIAIEDFSTNCQVDGGTLRRVTVIGLVTRALDCAELS